MRYLITVFIFLVSGLIIESCNKFTDVRPKGYVIPSTYADYDELLNAKQLCVIGNADIADIDDDEDYTEADLNNTADSRVRTYLWDDQLQLDITSDPIFWTECYGNIYYFNAVLKGIGSDVKDSVGRRLRAQALTGRAFEYLYLINLYSKPYDATSAESDPGVPFITSVDITDKTPDRSSVSAVYENIINDLMAAVPDLPADNGTNKFRANRASAYSILAKAYWFKNQFDSAEKYADMAVSNYSLTDYNQLSSDIFSGDDFGSATMGLSSTIFYRELNFDILDNAGYGTGYHVNLGLLNLYGKGDIRLKLFFSNTDEDSAFTKRGVAAFTIATNIAPSQGTTVEEMILIKAESEMEKNNLQNAVGLVNELRKNRIEREDYVPVAASDKDSVMALIYNERRREFPFTGMRWFDMRRLSALGRMPAVNRYNLNGNIVKTLQPKDPLYILQIPSKVIYYNSDMKQNPL